MDEVVLPTQVPGRPFKKGQSGIPRAPVRARATARRSPPRDPMALLLCIERILPACRERPVRFALPPIESADDVSAAMNAVTSALAGGKITPGEAERIAMVIETFARAISTTKRREVAVDPLQIFGLTSFDETDDCDFDEIEDGDPDEIEGGNPE